MSQTKINTTHIAFASTNPGPLDGTANDFTPQSGEANYVEVDDGASTVPPNPTKMARMCGRAPKGERCRADGPYGHWKTTTIVGARRLSGVTAPMTLDGAMNATAFLANVKKVLVRTLRPGDIVVMDITNGTNR